MLNKGGRLGKVDVAEKHATGEEKGRGVDHVLACVLWRTAMSWLKDRDLIANIGTGRNTQPAD